MSRSSEPTHSVRRRNWVSLVPYGLNRRHPNHYLEMLSTAWENRDSLGYASRILRDGCALGTKGMRDWTMKGVHLCALRLRLMHYNTMPAMDWPLLEDAAILRGMKEKQLRKLGRLAVPMVRRRGCQWPPSSANLIGRSCNRR